MSIKTVISDLKSSNFVQEFTKLLGNLEQMQDKLDKVSPDGLVTFSISGTVRTIKREHINKWTSDGIGNFFTFLLAEHFPNAKQSDGSFFIDRNPLMIDDILDMLRGITIDFDSFTAKEKTRLKEDIKYYQIEAVANKHLKNWNQLLPDPLESVVDHTDCKYLRFVISPGKVLYLTNEDGNCMPSANHGSDITTKILSISDGCFNNYDVVLINIWQGIVPTEMGDMLADYVDKGGNVVFFLFGNATSNNHAAGRFSNYNPFKLLPYVKNTTKEKLGWCNAHHPLMTDITSIQQTGELRRVNGELNPGDVDVVAKWSDGDNMIAIRHERKGLITSIGFPSGTSSTSGDVVRLTSNALRLRKR